MNPWRILTLNMNAYKCLLANFLSETDLSFQLLLTLQKQCDFLGNVEALDIKFCPSSAF